MRLMSRTLALMQARVTRAPVGKFLHLCRDSPAPRPGADPSRSVPVNLPIVMVRVCFPARALVRKTGRTC